MTSIPAREKIGSTQLAHFWRKAGFPVFGVTASKWPAFVTPPGQSIVPDPCDYLNRTGDRGEKNGGYHQASMHKDGVRVVVKHDTLVATPGPEYVLILDIDAPEKFDRLGLAEAWDLFQSKTMVVASRWPDTERRHVYIRMPSGVHVQTRIIPGGEICGAYRKGDPTTKANYWVVPNQERFDGQGTYRVLHGSPDTIATASPQIVQALLNHGEPAAVLPDGRGVSLKPSTFTDGSTEKPHAEIGIGGRNDRLFRDGCRIADGGATFEIMLEFLTMTNAQFAEPHGPEEVERAARSAWDRTQAKRTQAANARAAAEAEVPVREPAPPAETPQAAYERYCRAPEHVPLSGAGFRTVMARALITGAYNLSQRGDAAIELSIDGGPMRPYSDELHSARVWMRVEAVATSDGRPWRVPQQKRRREMLLDWLAGKTRRGVGTDVYEDVSMHLDALDDGIEFISRDLVLGWSKAARTTEAGAANSVPNSVWADIRKALADHESGWRDYRLTLGGGQRARGFARSAGPPKVGGVKLTVQQHKEAKT